MLCQHCLQHLQRFDPLREDEHAVFVVAEDVQHGDEERVQRVIDDLKGERFSRLERLRVMLETDDRPQFWELMDRGVNFAYLIPERRQYLEELLK